MTKAQVSKLMSAAGITGNVTGTGQDWEVELPSDSMKQRFRRSVCKLGGFKTGYGSWILRPGYTSPNPYA